MTVKELIDKLNELIHGPDGWEVYIGIKDIPNNNYSEIRSIEYRDLFFRRVESKEDAKSL